MLFGRVDCNENFPDDRQVSREHFKVTVIGADVYLEDLNASNTTRVNRRAVEPRRPTHLKFEDVIEFGDQKLIFTSNKEYLLVRANETRLSPLLEPTSDQLAAKSRRPTFLERLMNMSFRLRQRSVDTLIDFKHVKSWQWSTTGVAILCSALTAMALKSLSETFEPGLLVSKNELVIKVLIVWLVATTFATFANHAFLRALALQRMAAVFAWPLSVLVFMGSLLFLQTLISYPLDVGVNQISRDCLKSFELGRCSRAVRMGPTSLRRLPDDKQKIIHQRLYSSD